jgi:hypothetical protein
MAHVWSIGQRTLEEPNRAGGFHAEKGFVFQRTYAAWLLSGLLTNADGYVAIRYEGAQDVDILTRAGAEIYVQVKKYEKTNLDWSTFRSVAHRFLQDLVAAEKERGTASGGKVTFKLVAAACVSDQLVLNGLRGLSEKQITKRLNDELNALGSSEITEDKVREVLTGLTSEIFPAGFHADVYRLMAEARLQRFGIRQDSVDEAVRTILDKITWQATITSATVLDWIASYLPQAHPASRHGNIRSFADRIAGSAQLGRLYYTSQADVWTGIAQGLDVPRGIAADLRRAVISHGTSKILLHGPSGAGKSTAIRRVLWDLQQEGNIIAFEATGDLSDQEWDSLRNFAGRMAYVGGIRTVLLVDDVHGSSGMIQRANDLGGSSDLKIVAVTWTTRRQSIDLGQGQENIELRQISREEAAATAARLGSDLGTLSTLELARVCGAGQFIVLNFALLGDESPLRFAKRLLEKLRIEEPRLESFYIDLCACSAGDWSAPNELLDGRRDGWTTDSIFSPALAGLVFDAGSNRIRSGHRILSSAVLEAASVPRCPRLLSIAEAIRPENDEERRFAIGLLEQCAEDENYSSVLNSLMEKVARGLAKSGYYLDIRRCSRVLKKVGLSSAAAEVKVLSTFDRVCSGQDAALYRSDVEKSDGPVVAFDRLLAFFNSNDIAWGWKNFLQIAKELDRDRKCKAITHARKRSATHDLSEAEAKVIIDLSSTIKELPYEAQELTRFLINKFPESIAVCRAAAHLVMNNWRDGAFLTYLLDVAIPLFGVSGQQLLLAQNLAVATLRSGGPTDKRRMYEALYALVPACQTPVARAHLIKSVAELAEPADARHLLDLIGPESSSEPTRIVAARHILKRRFTA